MWNVCFERRNDFTGITEWAVGINEVQQVPVFKRRCRYRQFQLVTGGFIYSLKE